MKKKVLALLLTSAMLASMTACGGEKSADLEGITIMVDGTLNLDAETAPVTQMHWLVRWLTPVTDLM